MLLQVLSPRMQDAKEAYIGSEVPGAACHLEHGFGTRAIEQIVDDSLVPECQRREIVGKGEDDVEVGNGQEFCRSCLEPLGTCVPLALGTVAVAARVVGDGLMSAADALITMAAKSSSAAAQDGIERLAMWPGKMRPLLIPETVAHGADDVATSRVARLIV